MNFNIRFTNRFSVQCFDPATSSRAPAAFAAHRLPASGPGNCRTICLMAVSIADPAGLRFVPLPGPGSIVAACATDFRPNLHVGFERSIGPKFRKTRLQARGLDSAPGMVQLVK